VKAILAAAATILPALALAQSQPQTISGSQTIGYQGRLLKPDGDPMNQTLSIRFAIYAQPVGGTALWSETQSVTPNLHGYYAVFLGSSTAFPTNPPLFDGSDRYLGVTVGTDGELVPRQKIASVPYAIRADRAVQADSATSVTGPGAVVANLGYTPVQQQGSTTVRLGSSGTDVTAAVGAGVLKPLATKEYVESQVSSEASARASAVSNLRTFVCAVRGTTGNGSLVSTSCIPGLQPIVRNASTGYAEVVIDGVKFHSIVVGYLVNQAGRHLGESYERIHHGQDVLATRKRIWSSERRLLFHCRRALVS
jgi:hypothetical protein